MRIGTFNVLADAYLHYGDSSPSEPELQKPGGRIEPLKKVINSLGADVLALQEVDGKLAESIEQDGVWQTFWQQKGKGKSDGCLTLVSPDVLVDKSETLKFDNDSGHVAQIIRLGKLAIVNTHFKWSPPDDPEHKGLGQARELLAYLGGRQPAVILTDCNDRPGGPVRRCLAGAGFHDLVGDTPTAWVDGQAVSIDTIALRGVAGDFMPTSHVPAKPHHEMPSDHIPVLADIKWP